MFDLGDFNAECQGSERAVRRRVAIAAAYHAESGLREAKLGPDDMDGALPAVCDGNAVNAIVAAIALQSRKLRCRLWIVDFGAATGGGNIVIRHGQHEIRPAEPAPAQPQTFERLRSGDVMKEMPVDENQAGVIVGTRDNVTIPQLLVQGVALHSVIFGVCTS